MDNKKLINEEDKESTGKKLLNSVAKAGKKSASFIGDKLAQGVGQVVAGTKRAAEAVSAVGLRYITLEDYEGYGENRPNIIKIVDDTVDGNKGRKKDKIGWIGEAEGAEVLYLFDCAVEESGLKFSPYASCDEVYCVHPFDKSRYINVTTLYEIINNEKMAELQNIACDIGAKRCVIELTQSNTESQREGREASVDVETTGKDIAKGLEIAGCTVPRKIKKATKDIDVEVAVSVSKSDARSQGDIWSARLEAEFKGSHFAKEPSLKWFKGDSVIEGIIKSRKGLFKNKLQNNTYRITSSSVRAMNKSRALSLDFLISESKAGMKGSMQRDMEKEQNCVFVFVLEF